MRAPDDWRPRVEGARRRCVAAFQSGDMDEWAVACAELRALLRERGLLTTKEKHEAAHRRRAARRRLQSQAATEGDAQ